MATSSRSRQKVAAAQASDYERGVFWIAATLMALTTGGLIVNATPEWRIVSQAGLVPIVAHVVGNQRGDVAAGLHDVASSADTARRGTV